MRQKGERRRKIKGERTSTREEEGGGEGGKGISTNDDKQDEAEDRDKPRSGETGDGRLGNEDGDRRQKQISVNRKTYR